MQLLEHEAKTILYTNHLPVPKGRIISNATIAASLSTPIVLKSQVPVGGRSKLGGVIMVDDPSDLENAVKHLLSLSIKGYTTHVLLAEEKLVIKTEHYIALLIDRNMANIQLIAHKNGGVEVEENDAADFFTVPIDNTSLSERAGQLATYLGYSLALIEPLLRGLLDTFIKSDATLLEINPLIFTQAKTLVCGDCKMELDDAAAFRHPEWEFENEPSDTNFVILNPEGTIATIANGAGLAMATVDAVATNGMKPANFLDIGGGANTESVLKAFHRIIELPNVQAIVINIFAGITRCDEVAKAIIQAKKQIGTLPPLFIRLAGTNFEEAVALLAVEDITTLETLEECLEAAKGLTSA